MLSDKEVKHIADLARLALTDGEREKFKRELSSVLAYVVRLSEVETNGVEPTFQTPGLENIFREDQVESDRELEPEEALANAPEKKDGYFRVKPVF